MPETTDRFQQRVHDVVRQHPLALLPWDELARERVGLVADAAPLGPLRIGELRYERAGAAGGALRLPATIGHAGGPRHLLVSRPPQLAARAAALLNALALRFAIARDPHAQQLLLVDEFESRRGIPAALLRLEGRVSTFPPSHVSYWLREREYQPTLVAVHASHLEGAAPDDEERYNAFRLPALEELLERMRARAGADEAIALAFDPTDRQHPVTRAFEDPSFRAVRVTLGADGDAYDGATYRGLTLRFTPDAYPPGDIARTLLATE